MSQRSTKRETLQRGPLACLPLSDVSYNFYAKSGEEKEEEEKGRELITGFSCLSPLQVVVTGEDDCPMWISTAERLLMVTHPCHKNAFLTHQIIPV